MRPSNILALSAIDASTAGSQHSAPIPTSQILACSVQVVAVGTLTGAVSIEASNDPDKNPADPSYAPTNWVAIPSATVTVSAAGQFLIPKTELCYEFIRIVYTKTTSTGTPTVTVRVKELGL